MATAVAITAYRKTLDAVKTVPFPLTQDAPNSFTCADAPAANITGSNSEYCIFNNQTAAFTWCLANAQCKGVECHLYTPWNIEWCWCTALSTFQNTQYPGATNQQAWSVQIDLIPTTGKDSVANPVVNNSGDYGCNGSEVKCVYTDYQDAVQYCLNDSNCVGILCTQYSDYTSVCECTNSAFQNSKKTPASDDLFPAGI